MYFLTLAVAAFAPVLSDGFVLSLDMIFSPNTDYVAFTLREKGPLYYGRLPFMVALDAAALVVPHWVLQRLVLIGIVAGSGYAMARSVAQWGRLAGVFAGTLYAINPFVYVRVLAGHWYFLLGYAVLPLAVVSFHRYLDDPDWARLVPATLLATVVAMFDPHAAVLLAVAGATVLVAHLGHRPGDWRPTGRRALGFGVVATAVNAYWLVPALGGYLGGTAEVSAFSPADLATFSARGTVLGHGPLSTSMLYGFWRGGYRYPFDLVPVAVVVALFALLLFLAVSGWLDRRGDPLCDGLAIAAVAGVLIGLGVSWPPSQPLAQPFFQYTPIGLGMRDSQKFVGVTALAYAVLGAAGVARFDAEYRLSERAGRLRGWIEDGGSSAAGPPSRDLLAVLVCLLLVALPLLYTFPMVVGFWGQLETSHYPADWHAVNDRLQRDDGEYRVLVMPWHLYVPFEWAGGTVANPAPMFFDRPTLTSEAVEVGGITPREGDPTRQRVRTLLERGDPNESFGHEVAPLGFKYVLRFHVADDERYDFLDRQADLTPVMRTDQLVLYRNEAFETAPPPSQWPRATSPTPWGALLVGGVVSTVSIAALLRRHAGGW